MIHQFTLFAHYSFCWFNERQRWNKFLVQITQNLTMNSIIFSMIWWFILTKVTIIDRLILVNASSNDPSASANKSYHNVHQCPAEFNDKCHCGFRSYNGQYVGKYRLTFVTNCTDTKFNDSSILSHVPIETEILIFTGNNLTELPANLLGKNLNYSKLTLVDLSRNGIKSIDNNTFENMEQVRTMILNDNDIIIKNSTDLGLFSPLRNLEELHLRKAFNLAAIQSDSAEFIAFLYRTFNQSHLINLKILNLEQNHIDLSTNQQFFCIFPQLRRLLLAQNSISQFNFNLSCLTELSLLDMSANQITTLDNRSISLLTSGISSYRVNISENPFHCDCMLKDFFKFMSRHNSFLEWYEEFKCYDGPSDVVGKYLDDIKESQMICEPEEEISMVDIVGDDSKVTEQQKKEAIRRYRQYITFSYIVLAFLLTLLVFLIGVLIHTNREYIQSSWAIFWLEYNSKSDYTVLDKDSSYEHGWWKRIRRGEFASINPKNSGTGKYRRSTINKSSSNIAEEQL